MKSSLWSRMKSILIQSLWNPHEIAILLFKIPLNPYWITITIYNILIYILLYYRKKFRSQTSDNMDRWKAEMGRVREEKRRRKRKSQKKEDPGARKGRKVAKHYVFPMICGSGGSKSRLAKAAGAEPAGQMRDEKLHAVVAQSTFPSQNV